MALLRAPNQFTPGGSGGPVTPSCCGCCCCCCCAGTITATAIALPLVLHQVAPKAAAATTQPDAPAVMPDVTAQPATPDESRAPAGRGQRALGILIAALALPLGAVVVVLVPMLMGNAGLASLAPGAVVIAVLALIGYAVAGVRSVGLLTPIVIVLVGIVLLGLELLLWAALILDESSTALQVIGGLMIVAIPVISTIMIIAIGRRRRTGQPA
jgi:hypothetical protein